MATLSVEQVEAILSATIDANWAVRAAITKFDVVGLAHKALVNEHLVQFRERVLDAARIFIPLMDTTTEQDMRRKITKQYDLAVALAFVEAYTAQQEPHDGNVIG